VLELAEVAVGDYLPSVQVMGHLQLCQRPLQCRQQGAEGEAGQRA
jgi:hypothetical protein